MPEGIEILIQGRDALSPAANSAASSLDRLEGSAKSSTGMLGNLSAGFKTLAIGAAAGAAALIGLGVVAFKLGADFDAAYDKIRIGTGATGETLKTLEADFKAVFSAVPTDMESASTAIADLNTRLGLTGKPLQAMSTQMLELSRITKTDVSQNVALATRMFGDWSVATEDQGTALDKVFRASQATGAGVSELMSKVVQYGAPLRAMNFSMDESVALLGKWEKEGVNTELVLGSLRIAMGQFADEGVPMRQGLEDTIASIQKMGPGAEAVSLAMEVFGARAGPDMAAAILEGRFAFDEYVKAIAEGEDTIVGLGRETMDAGEKFTILKNKIMTAVGPIASKLFGLGGVLIDNLLPHIERLAAWIDDTLVPAFDQWLPIIRNLTAQISSGLSPVLETVGGAITTVWHALQEFLGQRAMIVGALGVVAVAFAALAVAAVGAAVPILTALAPVIAIVAVVAAAGALLYKAWESNFLGIQDIVAGLGEAIGAFWADKIEPFITEMMAKWQEFAEFIGPLIGPAMQNIANVIGTVLGAIVGFFREHWGIIQGIIDGVWKVIRGIIEVAWSVISGIIKIGLALLSGDWSLAWTALKDMLFGVWEGIKSIITGALEIITGFLKLAWKAITELTRPMWEEIANIILGVFGAIKKGIGIAINWVIDRLNDFVRRINEVINLLNSIPGVSLPNIGEMPHVALAKGGIVTAPTLALLGERGPEAVVPLSGGRGYGAINIYVMAPVYGVDHLEEVVVSAVEQAQRRGRLD